MKCYYPTTETTPKNVQNSKKTGVLDAKIFETAAVIMPSKDLSARWYHFVEREDFHCRATPQPESPATDQERPAENHSSIDEIIVTILLL